MQKSQQSKFNKVRNTVLEYRPHYFTATAGSMYVAYMEATALTTAISSTSAVAFVAAAPIACGVGLVAGAGAGLYFASNGKNTNKNSANIKNLEEELSNKQTVKKNIQKEKITIENDLTGNSNEEKIKQVQSELLHEREEESRNKALLKSLKQEKVKRKFSNNKMSPG